MDSGFTTRSRSRCSIHRPIPHGCSSTGRTRARRIYDLGSEATALAVNSDPATESALRDLGRTLGSLVGAIDTNVGLRVSADPTDASAREALTASNHAVQARRAELAAVLVPLQQVR